jgi:hypothetical protein
MRRLHIGTGLFLLTYAGFALADPGTLSLSSILTAAAGSAAGAVVSGLFKGDKPAQQQAAPAVEPVTPMPGPNDAAIQDAKRKSIVAQIQRQGRASTILTQGNTASDTMG